MKYVRIRLRKNVLNFRGKLKNTSEEHKSLDHNQLQCDANLIPIKY